MAYIGRQNLGGAYRQLDDISSNFNSSTTAFTMQVNSQNVTLGDVNQIILSLGGVIQKPGTDFTVSGSTLTFTTAPAANTNFFAILLGSDNGGTVTPTDGSVTGDKLASTVTTSSNISLDGGTFVFNESGADKDFRIESDSNTHMLFVDAGNNVIGVNESSPSSYYYNDLVVNSGDEGGITIVDTSSGQSALAFGDSTSGAARYAGRVLYDHNTDTIEIGAGGSTYLKVDGSGHMTNASQPCFRIGSGTQNNISVSTNNDVVFDSEVFDVGNNFASNTFTAPVTGKYFLSVLMRLNTVDSASSYIQVSILGSNRNTTIFTFDNGADLNADADNVTISGSTVLDMDANDTSSVRIRIQGGTAQTDLDGDGSYFTGYLIG